MPRKKSVRFAARQFIDLTDDLTNYSNAILASGLSDQQITWCFEAGLIKLTAGFDRLMLHAIVGAINNDTSTMSEATGTSFPRHMTDEVCEYLVTHGGYFDYRGRDSLIRQLKRFVPDSHYLVQIIKKSQYKSDLERLVALRNFAAHEDKHSKRAAIDAVGTNMSSAGSWVKRQGRYVALASKLRQLAAEIEQQAPY